MASSLTFQCIQDPHRGATRPLPSDLASLAELLGEQELAHDTCALAMAIRLFEAHVHERLQKPSWCFFQDLLPHICTWAVHQPWCTTPLPLLTQGQASSVTLPRAQVRCLIANAFLLNITCPDRSSLPLPPLPPPSEGARGRMPANPDTFGKHSWRNVFMRNGCDLSAHKILCLLAYFYDTAQRFPMAPTQAPGGAAQAAAPIGGDGDSAVQECDPCDDDDDDGPGVVIERVNAASVAAAAKGAAEALTTALGLRAAGEGPDALAGEEELPGEVLPGEGPGEEPQGADIAEVAAATAAAGSWQFWCDSAALICKSMVRLHTGSMESSPAHAFVDFANKFVGYRHISSSMTQEEVLWCVVPEVQPASLLCECMAADEAVIIRNVRRISDYSGYLRTFRWRGFWTPPPAAAVACATGASTVVAERPSKYAARHGRPGSDMEVLVIDATVVDAPWSQFKPDALTRDLTKAWVSFMACQPPSMALQGGLSAACSGASGAAAAETMDAGSKETVTAGAAGVAGVAAGPPEGGATTAQGAGLHGLSARNAISTGLWGCGMFRGHRVLKFLQQLCAVAQANSYRPASAQLRLDFSTFKDAQLCECLQQLVDVLDRSAAEGRAVTVGQACMAMARFHKVAEQHPVMAEGDEPLQRWLLGQLAPAGAEHEQWSAHRHF